MASLSLNNIADIIINGVYGGLKAPANYALSKEQVKDEIILTKNRLVFELSQKNPTILKDFLYQIPCIEVECSDFTRCCIPGIKSYHNLLKSKSKLPSLLEVGIEKSISYVGTIDGRKSFMELDRRGLEYQKYNRYSKHAPSFFIDDDDYLYIINPPTESLTYILVVGLFEDPREITASCACVKDDDPYPMPSYMTDMITGKLIDSYIRQYKAINPTPLPNTQTDTVEMPVKAK